MTEPGAAALAMALGCYALKLLGVSVPERWLDDPRVRTVSFYLPIALLAALTAVQTFADGRHLTVDARLAGVLAAVVALTLRAPFIVVIVVAAVVAALVRQLGIG